MAGLYTSVDVYLEKYTSGVLDGVLIGPINCSSLTFGQEDGETVNRTSYRKDMRGQALDSIVNPGTQTVSFTTDEAGSAEMYAFAVLGSTADVSQSSGDVTDEAVTIVTVGKWHKLAAHNISSVVVQDDTDTTTYTLGTDYDLDLENGLIKALSGGSIAADDVLHVDYTKAAVTGERVSAAQASSITCKMHLFGNNEANDKQLRGVVYKAVLSPDGDQEFVGDDFVQISMSGTMTTPDGYSTPYILDFDS